MAHLNLAVRSNKAASEVVKQNTRTSDCPPSRPQSITASSSTSLLPYSSSSSSFKMSFLLLRFHSRLDIVARPVLYSKNEEHRRMTSRILCMYYISDYLLIVLFQLRGAPTTTTIFPFFCMSMTFSAKETVSVRDSR